MLLEGEDELGLGMRRKRRRSNIARNLGNSSGARPTFELQSSKNLFPAVSPRSLLELYMLIFAETYREVVEPTKLFWKFELFLVFQKN